VPARSLKHLLLTHELALIFLVVVTGALGAMWVYFWQKTSVESVRLTGLTYAAHEIRTDLFRQIKEVTLARLMEDPKALRLYNDYSRRIDQAFNSLRQRTHSRPEELAIQEMQRAYRVIQLDMNKIFDDPYLLNRMARLKVLDPRYEQQLVGNFEQAFSAFAGLLEKQQKSLEDTLRHWTRLTPLLLPLPIGLAIALLLWSRRSLQRGFVRPVADLMSGTRLISAGHLDQRVPEQGVAEMASLAQAVNQMAEEIKKSRDALVESEKQAVLGALVPVVAHNIRNPLASIRATAQMLDHEEGPESLGETRQAIVETVDRLGRWVNSLVSYLHPLKPHPVEARVSGLARAATGLLQPKIRDKGIRVREHLLADEPAVAVDVDLMEQAFYGVLLNAVEASLPGGEITIREQHTGDTLLLTIEDRGPGMPFQPEPGGLTPGPSTKRFGTGLGIPIAFKVCNAHSWRLKFSTGAGGGACVTFEIPLPPKTNTHP
jgi:signal transduction histidine kinase